MPDHMTREQRSFAMKCVKLRNGSMERVVHQELKARGLKFRRHVRTLPGSPDIVFVNNKVAVFVDGDFWHGWRLPAWERKLHPFWREKLRANRKRDQRNFRKLRVCGWKVIRIWQHQLTDDREACINRILQVVLVREGTSFLPKQTKSSFNLAPAEYKNGRQSFLAIERDSNRKTGRLLI